MDGTREVGRIVPAREMTEGAGVRVRRSLGGPELDVLDPFLLLDEFRSDDPSDYVAGFPEHPHRGFETVTYMLEGAMEHRDHKGNHGVLGPGSIQWMTAGRGIVHSEMPLREGGDAASTGRIHGFQLWVNLPAERKMCEPRYQDVPAERVPEVDDGAARVRVLTGELDGTVGPVRGIAVDPLYLDVRLPAGASWVRAIPDAHRAFAYVFDGEVAVGPGGSTSVPASHLAVLGAGDAVRLEAGSRGASLLLVAGRPIGEPIARYGPFVMTTREELLQAFRDYRSGRLQA